MKCFKYNKINNRKCKIKKCRYWIEESNSQNCVYNFKTKEKITLEEIGKIFNVTRMRICQIEKNAMEKIKKTLVSLRSF